MKYAARCRELTLIIILLEHDTGLLHNCRYLCRVDRCIFRCLADRSQLSSDKIKDGQATSLNDISE